MPVTLKPSGHVEIEKIVGGGKWRRVIMPHDESELDAFAPDLAPEAKQAILTAWEAIPAPDTSSPVATAADVQAECARRLSLGFDYDFEDERGVHRIGTTERDMAGWDEVTKLAQALINAGTAGESITIATDTGVCQVTATEWNAVLLAAAAFRQPIWQASFTIQADLGEMTVDEMMEDERWP